MAVTPRRSGRRSLILIWGLLALMILGQRFSGPLASIRIVMNTNLGSRNTSSLGQDHHIHFVNDCPSDRQNTGHSAAFNGESSQLAVHTYRNDGLLEVNPDGGHPVFELIHRAEEEWQGKYDRSSKTLEEAVSEYQRRHNRLPPLGFDEWWNYAVRHQVQLPDEFDQIYRDLEPFWGISPEDLQAIQRDWESHVDSFTIGKDSLEDPIGIKNYSLRPEYDPNSRHGPMKGAYEIMDLLKEVQGHIPAFRAVFSPHDNPNIPADYGLRDRALKAKAAGTYVDINKPIRTKLDGWLNGCPPNSPARKQRIRWGESPHRSRNKTFIYDHLLAMDPCQNPSTFLLHGQFLSHFRGPESLRKLIPQFSYCSTAMHQDIRAAMPINWVDDVMPRQNDPEWEDKRDGRLQWRGSNTGIWHADELRWDLAHRVRLIRWAGDGSSLDVRDGYSRRNETILMPISEGERVGKGLNVDKALWAPAMLDIAFVDHPINCPPEICEKLEELFEFRKRQEGPVAGRYKYVVDVDGNGWSSRFKRLITSNALIFKSTVYAEWYTGRIAPWVHYIPVQVDLSDLWDSLVFFRGDLAGNNAHEDLAMKIAKAGREWSKTFWRREDMTAYMFRLFLEYARLMDPERRSYDPSA